MENKKFTINSSDVVDFSIINYEKIKSNIKFSFSLLTSILLIVILLIIGSLILSLVEFDKSIKNLIILILIALVYTTYSLVFSYLVIFKVELMQYINQDKMIINYCFKNKSKFKKIYWIPLFFEIKFYKILKKNNYIEKDKSFNACLNENKISREVEIRKLKILKKQAYIISYLLNFNIILIAIIVGLFTSINIVMLFEINFDDLFLYVPLLLVFIFSITIWFLAIAKMRKILIFTKWCSKEMINQQKLGPRLDLKYFIKIKIY